MANIKDVASYLVSLSQPSSPRAITPSKLQKLVYFAQGVLRLASFDDLETMRGIRGKLITSQEHDPAENVQSMFDHVANKSGKLYRYDDKENPYLETHGYDFNGTMSRQEDYL